MRQQFVEKGWVKIEDAVPLENIKKFSDDIWIRLGFDPNDKSTWTKEKIHTPRHREMVTKEFAPRGWQAICELVGGADRIDPGLFQSCGDSLIVNLGTKELEWNDDVQPRMLGNWHIDGDWFRHFLDSGEQALTVIVLFNDIKPRCGGTYISPDGIKNVVKWLYDHPEGSDGWDVDETGSRTVCNIQQCSDFVELTGNAGDMILFHPFMPHSASKNYNRVPRFITNPPVTLKQPFNLNRDDPAEYSLVEQVILRALKENGVESASGWKPSTSRRRFTPRTRAGKDVLINEEVARMKAYSMKTGGSYQVDSMHINGPVPYQTVITQEGY